MLNALVVNCELTAGLWQSTQGHGAPTELCIEQGREGGHPATLEGNKRDGDGVLGPPEGGSQWLCQGAQKRRVEGGSSQWGTLCPAGGLLAVGGLLPCSTRWMIWD